MGARLVAATARAEPIPVLVICFGTTRNEDEVIPSAVLHAPDDGSHAGLAVGLIHARQPLRLTAEKDTDALGCLLIWNLTGTRTVDYPILADIIRLHDLTRRRHVALVVLDRNDRSAPLPIEQPFAAAGSVSKFGSTYWVRFVMKQLVPTVTWDMKETAVGLALIARQIRLWSEGMARDDDQ